MSHNAIDIVYFCQNPPYLVNDHAQTPRPRFVTQALLQICSLWAQVNVTLMTPLGVLRLVPL